MRRFHLFDQTVDIDRGQRRDLHGAARGEIDGKMRDRFIVTSFDDCHKIVVPKGGILLHDLAPEVGNFLKCWSGDTYRNSTSYSSCGSQSAFSRGW